MKIDNPPSPFPSPRPWSGLIDWGEGGGEGKSQIFLARILVIETLVIVWCLVIGYLSIYLVCLL